MPVFGDQKSNKAETQAHGWTIMLDWDHLTEETFKNAIIQGLSEKRYIIHLFHQNNIIQIFFRMREIVKTRSKLMRDQRLSAKEKFRYWVNYVVQHKGAHHLKSPMMGMP